MREDMCGRALTFSAHFVIIKPNNRSLESVKKTAAVYRRSFRVVWNAIKSRFRPAEMEMTANPIETVDRMNER